MSTVCSSLICGLDPTDVVLGQHTGPSATTGLLTVNKYPFNQVTAHTGAACQLPSTIASTVGRVVGKRCQTIDGNNAECAFFTDHNHSTYRHGFNMNGGGFYARIWDEQLIKV